MLRLFQRIEKSATAEEERKRAENLMKDFQRQRREQEHWNAAFAAVMAIIDHAKRCQAKRIRIKSKGFERFGDLMFEIEDRRSDVTLGGFIGSIKDKPEIPAEAWFRFKLEAEA